MLAHLMIAENYSRIALSEYVNELVSSIEVIGAVIVAKGTCSLEGASIAMNISTRVPTLEG